MCKSYDYDNNTLNEIAQLEFFENSTSSIQKEFILKFSLTALRILPI